MPYYSPRYRYDPCPVKARGLALYPRGCHLFGLFFCVLLLGCDRGDVSLLDPGDSVPEANSLSLKLVLSGESGVLPASFGWPDGVPGVDVTLLRVRDLQDIGRTEGVTDAAGSVGFERLSRGLQWVTGFRWLEGAEEEALPVEWPVAVLAGGGKVPVTGATDTILALRPPWLGTMVISEVAAGIPDQFETGGGYYGSLYLELFNNGATTVFLDGMLLGKGYEAFFDYSRFGHHACVDSEPMRVDPEGLWAARIWRFPGAGDQFPVSPGEAVVVAVSATDHTDIHPAMLDLTGADFEFLPSDLPFADNPTAPNLEDVGPEPFIYQAFFGTFNNWFLAAPTDIEILPRESDPAAGSALGVYEYVRIPTQNLLDVVHIWWDNAGSYTPNGADPICEDPTNPAFDAVPGGFDTLHQPEISAQRLVVRARDGRIVLLDTDVSALDFVMQARTPGWILEVAW